MRPEVEIERLEKELAAALGRVGDLNGQLDQIHDEAAELMDMLCQHMRVSPESIQATVRSRLKPIESKEGGA
jgi:hypothetical protein